MLEASEYSHFVNGGVYNEDVVLGSSGLSVKSLVMRYPNDWEEVAEEVELPKKFKFKGDVEDGSYGGLVVGEVYNLTDRCPYSEFGVEEYNFVKYYVEKYPNDWEEVLVTLSPTGSGNIYVSSVPKIITDAEVITLITFLNDNFEDFNSFIESFSWDGGLDIDFYIDLDGGEKYKSSLLIDKLEKNNTPLTEAEKVTLITFLNDKFEDFRTFTIYDLDFEFYDKLDADEEFEVAYLLIDKIELS